jgi:hypothetical protein
MPDDDGRAVVHEKRRDSSDASEPAYHVNLSDAARGCSCKGYAAHRRCKHREALTALRAEGGLS